MNSVCEIERNVNRRYIKVSKITLHCVNTKNTFNVWPHKHLQQFDETSSANYLPSMHISGMKVDVRDIVLSYYYYQ